MKIWDVIKTFFKRTENWGKPDKVSGILLLVMFHIREHVGHPIHINNSFREGKSGQHPKGNAVDFYIKGVPFLEACYLLEKAIKDLQLENHIGLGIYLDWNIRGFHLDVRGERARWSRIEGKYKGMQEGINLALGEQETPNPRYSSISF